MLTIPKRIIVGSDHAGVAHKASVIKHLLSIGVQAVEDVGAFSDASVDYPDIAAAACAKMVQPQVDYPDTLAILLCGTGIGISIAANKCTLGEAEAKALGVDAARAFRAALCYNADCAVLARQHNSANILCMGARQTAAADMLAIVDAFIGTEFEGGRHTRRIEKFGTVITHKTD